jgi:phosphoglycolate phosphatase
MEAADQDPGGPARLAIPIRLGVVFDLDGTLIDSKLDIAAAANHALPAHGFPALPVEEIASYVGDGARTLLARAARLDSADERLDALLGTFLDYYAAHPTDHTVLLPGAREALEALGELPLALCTNKPRAITDQILSNLRLAQTFRVVVGGGDLPKSKPDPLPLQHIAGKLGLSTAELVMVGDGEQDIYCAKNASARSVGVAGGLQGSERMLAAAPDASLSSLRELPALIRTWLERAER